VTAPIPPPDLPRRKPHLVDLADGSIVHRFYTARFEPIFFDKSRSGRLNAPDGTYGVLYAAATLAGAFAETFLRHPGRTLLARDFLASKAYVRLGIRKPLRLIKLSGPGLGRLGATAEVVHSGLPYDVPQAWSAALRAHPVAPHGIAYNARHDDEALCYAIFEDAADALEEIDRNLILDADWFWAIAEPYGVGLAPS
jgi:hypothetical protein